MVEERKMAGRRRLAVVRALLWEQWRQTRVVLAVPIVVAALLVAGWFMFAAMLSLDPFGEEGAGEWILAFSVLGIALPVLVVPFSHCEKESIQVGLPQRILALPVSTRTLALAYLGYRMVALGASAFVTTLLGALPLMDAMDAPTDIVIISLLAAAATATVYAYIQAVLWTIGAIHAVLGGIVIVVFAPLVYGAVSEAFDIFPSVTPLFICLAGFAALAYVGFAPGRKCGWVSVRNRLGLGLAWRTPVMKPFASAAEAQQWFEWRRRGRVFRIAALSFQCLFVVVWLSGLDVSGSIGFDKPGRLTPDLYIGFSIASLGIGAFLAGMLSLSCDYRDHVTGLNTFTMSRCLPTRGLAMARLKATGWSVVSTYLVLLAGLVVWVFATGAEDHFANTVVRSTGLYEHGHGWNGIGFPTPVVGGAPIPTDVLVLSTAIGLLAVFGHAVLMWAVANFLAPLVLWLGFLCGTGIVSYLLLSHQVASADVAALIVIASALVLGFASMAAVVVWAFLTGRRRRISGVPSVLAMGTRVLGIVGALSVFFALSFYREYGMSFWDVAGGVALWAVASVGCCAPFVVTPVWVHWLRHR